MTTTLAKALALIEAHRKATPAPWHTCGLPWFRTGSGVLAGSPDPHAGALIVDTEPLGCEREEMIAHHPHLRIADPDDDAAFIATARNDAPVVAKALVEATDLLKGAAGILEGEGFHRSAGIIRAFLAKHGDGG